MIRQKWNGIVPHDPEGKGFSLKFPNMLKIDCSVVCPTPKVAI